MPIDSLTWLYPNYLNLSSLVKTHDNAQIYSILTVISFAQKKIKQALVSIKSESSKMTAYIKLAKKEKERLASYTLQS